MIAEKLSNPPGETNVEDVCTVIVDLPSTATEDIRYQKRDDPDIKKIIDTFDMLSDAVDVSILCTG